MKKSLIFSSLILSSMFLSACGTKPVLKQMNKDAFGTLPDVKLTAQEMIAAKASFSCVKNTGNGFIKFSYSEGKVRIDKAIMSDPNKPGEQATTTTQLFDGEMMYAFDQEKGYQEDAKSFLAEIGLAPKESVTGDDVVSVLASLFEYNSSPSQCQDEVFAPEYFKPVQGIEYKTSEKPEQKK